MFSLYSDSGGDRIFLNFFGLIFFYHFMVFEGKVSVFFLKKKLDLLFDG